jgi:hypothetical protein
MCEHDAGTLSDNDPFYHFLADEVMGNVLGYCPERPIFDVFCLDNSATVFRYAERKTFVNLVGKFYGRKWLHGRQTGEEELRAEYMQREFDNLQKLRALGLDSYPHCVVRPLSVSQAHNCVLVEEFVFGTSFDCYVTAALQSGNGDELYRKLTDLAWFFAHLHARSQSEVSVDQIRGLDYFGKMINDLSYWNIISVEQQQQFLKLQDRWRATGLLNTGKNVLTHGDAVFPNFLCSGEHGITSIDLERLWPGDAAMDLGCVVAELKHLFFIYSHNIWASEPYIQHFYESYFNCLPKPADDFSTLTSRGRFYMGCYELRMSRNAWLDLDYRHMLINEAESCLQI